MTRTKKDEFDTWVLNLVAEAITEAEQVTGPMDPHSTTNFVLDLLHEHGLEVRKSAIGKTRDILAGLTENECAELVQGLKGDDG